MFPKFGLIFLDNIHVARIFESGAFNGFSKTALAMLQTEVLPWKVYTEIDIIKNKEYKTSGSYVDLGGVIEVMSVNVGQLCSYV